MINDSYSSRFIPQWDIRKKHVAELIFFFYFEPSIFLGIFAIALANVSCNS